MYRGYRIKSDQRFGYFTVHSEAQGGVPKPLRGSFTTKTICEKAIDSYLNSLKGKRRGKASSTDRTK